MRHSPSILPSIPSVSIGFGYPGLLLLHTPLHPPLLDKWAVVAQGSLRLCDSLSKGRVCQCGRRGVIDQGRGVSPNDNLEVQLFQEFQMGLVVDPLTFHWRVVD